MRLAVATHLLQYSSNVANHVRFLHIPFLGFIDSGGVPIGAVGVWHTLGVLTLPANWTPLNCIM